MIEIREQSGTKRELQRVEELCEEQVSLCMQCGTCSASCPSSPDMDLTPRALMHLAQLGQLERVLASGTIWTCSACLKCAAVCPRGIDLTRVMEAFRAVRLRARLGKVDPKDACDPALADAPPILLIAAMRKLTG